MFAKKFPRGNQPKPPYTSTLRRDTVPSAERPLPRVTNSSAPNYASPLVSPLQMTFDFELSHSRSESPFRVSEDSFVRPKTSDGALAANQDRRGSGVGATASGLGKSTVSLAPPVLPPIPRVASTHGSVASAETSPHHISASEDGSKPRDERDNFSVSSRASARRRASQPQPFTSTLERPIDLPPPASQASPGGARMHEAPRPRTAGETVDADGVPRMLSSIFPPAPRPESPQLPEIDTGPAMTREFIDSRDRPYSNPVHRPPQNSQTAPQPVSRAPMLPKHTPNANASWINKNARGPGLDVPTPTSATSLRAPKISGVRLSPNESVEDLRAVLQRAPSTTTMVTAPLSAQSGSVSARGKSSRSSDNKSPAPATPSTLTIGIPYGDTSSAFPLPQHVATRPKTAGATAMVAGVTVPTHHTSKRPTVSRTQSEMSPAQTEKSERRKTRLLNPLALLTRRKSGQDDVVVDKSVAAQAYARQKSVAAVGVSELPTDYVGIKGKVVHDFSAPKPTRGLSHEPGNEILTNPNVSRQLQSSSSAPSGPPGQTDPPGEHPSLHAQQRSDGSSGGVSRSVHSPVFREMLAEDPDVANRVSSLNAERLENKDFLSRVSHNSSHTSNFSQESAVLPPFARRSQQFNLDPMQASLYHDVDSKRSSDQSTSGRGERDSGGSSVVISGPVGTVSPITARSSRTGAGSGGEAGTSVGMQSMSPTSPSFSNSPEPDAPERSWSAISAATASAQMPGAAVDARDRESGEAVSGDSGQPNMTPLAEDAPWSSRERSPYPEVANAADAHETLPFQGTSSLGLPPSSSSHSFSPSTTAPERTSSLGTTPEQGTPEISQAEFVRPVSTAAAAGGVKIVEKRASAVGHAKRASLKPKHQSSIASRFSFQFGGESAAEEEKLEEKHRKIKGRSRGFSRSRSPDDDDDDDDDFDEDAMDDMDEFEVEHQHTTPPVVMSANAPWTHPNGSMSLMGVRQGMRLAQSEDGSAYDGEEQDDGHAVVHPGWKPEGSEQTYADHPDFMAHYRTGSKATIMTYGSTLDHYLPGSGNSGPGQLAAGLHASHKSTASALSVNTDILGAPRAPVAVAPGQISHTQPQAAGYAVPAVPGPPPLPPREVNTAETEERKSRRIGGASLSSPKSQEYRASRISSLNAVDAEQGREGKAQSMSPVDGSSITGPTPQTTGTNAGLGLTGFQGFKFSDDSTDSLVANQMSSSAVEHQRPGTSHGEAMGGSGGWAELAKQPWPANKAQASNIDTRPSKTAAQGPAKTSMSSSGDLSHAYRGSVGKHIRARNQKADRIPHHVRSDAEHDPEDDMYFDDGGFEQEIRHPVHNRKDQTADEDKMDEEGYLPRINQHATGPRSGAPGPTDVGGYHQRDASEFSVASLGSDGPYPSFAMGANPIKQRARESMMLLEDLPLQVPVDPKLIPQRNPSEDAKRLGLSDRVPPLPVPEGGDAEVVRRMQTNLAAYHAALAEAANRAQEEGRFARMPSTASTALNGSLRAKESFDDRSFYSRDDGAGRLVVGGDGLSSSISNLTRESEPDGSKASHYSPPKMSFDFGFDDSSPQQNDATAFLDDHSLIDDFGTEDDIVAAANAEALANDEDGFYGSEFGFYAKARPNSSDTEAINGGYFGEDGDDGLARGRSGMEPNLTPITERSEFSTRNSFINLGHGGAFGPASAGLYGQSIGPASPALARMAVTSIVPENDVANFGQLRKLRANAFGGSNGSLRNAASPGRNSGSTGSNAGLGLLSSPNSTKSPTSAQGYFGPMSGTHMAYGYSDHGSSNSTGSGSNTSSAHPSSAGGWSGFHIDSPPSRAWMPQENSSPRSSSSGFGHGQQQCSSPLANAYDLDATPRKLPTAEPMGTARKAAPTFQLGESGREHSRKGSDAVTYVKEKDPTGSGKPQWVLERRRTGEQGQMELVGREVVQGGWI
ncbi:hypothetical protein Tdes44962_MAKER09408 [Teratosphaeria destructans]|uniref:Uncharacterized protein n=1 Tax=Teratosphaeria destructans TaxID=418781 RepID=A0A9W7ST21_9PEZI|nr:hypothetical protein Tdes44962_MAKER09408 [Teratosphaeria destructans]